ncbi:MAG: DUF1801 domain-containing protein [Spirochaetaceae bacterium]|nr:DUF1801 domain-containing protein [Spirochaetaceae bacterium]
MNYNPKVSEVVFNKKQKYEIELNYLRNIVLSLHFTEELKWGQACYCINGKNVVLIAAFKEYFALIFFKGALLNNDAGLLTSQTEKVQGGRIIKFTGLDYLRQHEKTVKNYLQEAIEVEEQGLKIPQDITTRLPIPPELNAVFNKDSPFKDAFCNLTLGRQRGYLLYFSDAKQSKTRIDRINHSRERIFAGLGLHE